MPIPPPPADASGGIIVMKYTSASATHRLRVHCLAFNADATGSYLVPPGGGDASVVATFTALANSIKPIYNNTWTFSLDAVFKVVAGVVTEVFHVVAPAAIIGTNATAGGSLHETFFAYNFRTTAGGKMRFFLLSPTGWLPNLPYIVLAGDATDTGRPAVAATAATSAVLAHDGTKPVLPSRVTAGLNKRLRRRWGDA